MAPKDKVGPASSYPGIWKYPTNREAPFRIAEDWMAAKRKDDDIETLWRVHDKLYNLDPFIKNHPGGSEWLIMSRGTDITEAFESCHTVNMESIEKLLTKFYVRDATQPRISPFTFKQDGFYKTLKRRIEPVLKEVGTGPTKSILFMQDSLVLVSILLGVLGAIYNSTALAVLSGVCFAFEAIGAHNFSHARENWRKYYLDLTLISSYEWRITHFFSHHLYPNTLMDMELTMFPSFQFLPNRPKPWYQRYFSVFYSHLMYASGFWIDFIKRFAHVVLWKKEFRPENAIVFFELLGLMLITDDIQAALKMWLIIHTVSSYTFLTIGAAAAHHHPDIFHDGDEALPDPDFGIGQLDATRDRAETLFQNLFVVIISFGHHPLHHLFPAICHSKLHHLKTVFDKTVSEFQLNYPTVPQAEMYIGCYKQLARTDTKKRKNN